jgi:hypothetical protein
MEWSYLDIGIGHGLVIGGFIALMMLMQLGYLGYLWVNDMELDQLFIKKKWFFGWDGNFNQNFWGDGVLLGIGVALLVVLVWPLVVPSITVYFFLCCLRGFIRLKRKVNKITGGLKNESDSN